MEGEGQNRMAEMDGECADTGITFKATVAEAMDAYALIVPQAHLGALRSVASGRRRMVPWLITPTCGHVQGCCSGTISGPGANSVQKFGVQTFRQVRSCEEMPCLKMMAALFW